MNVSFIYEYGGAEIAASLNLKSGTNDVLKLTVQSEIGEIIHKLTVNQAINLICELEDRLDEIKRAERYIKEIEEAGA